MTYLTYEAFLDEVTTLLTEMYELDDEAAIKIVVDAQAAEYFSPHDDHEEMRTIERAKEDAVALFTAKKNRVQTQQHQQMRTRQKNKPQR
jgi:intracellular sulfur oxidation DsrE/DsrF family protein